MVTDRAFTDLKKEAVANRLCNGVGYRIKRTATGTVLDLRPSKGGGFSHPFQAITSVAYTGTGSPPSNQGLKFKVRAGVVVGPDGNRRFASNKNAEFTAPDNNTDGYYLWAKLTFVSTGETAVTFSAFIYEAGTSIPNAEAGNATTGACPSNVYLPLFYVTTKDGSIDSVEQLITSSQQVSVEVQNITCTEKIRQLKFNAI